MNGDAFSGIVAMSQTTPIDDLLLSSNWLQTTNRSSTPYIPPIRMAGESEQYPVNWPAILLVVFIVFGVFGNTLICIAIPTDRRLQNPTNYFLMSLAVADLLVCVLVMPFSIITTMNCGRWHAGFALCAFHSYTDVFLCSASIVHITSISLDRYVGISRPLTNRRFKSRFVVTLKIAIVWLLTVVISFPLVLVFVLKPDDVYDGLRCQLSNKYYMIYGSTLAFIIPILINFVTYLRTTKLLKQQAVLCSSAAQRTSIGGLRARRLRRTRSNKPSTRALVRLGVKSSMPVLGTSRRRNGPLQVVHSERCLSGNSKGRDGDIKSRRRLEPKITYVSGGSFTSSSEDGCHIDNTVDTLLADTGSQPMLGSFSAPDADASYYLRRTALDLPKNNQRVAAADTASVGSNSLRNGFSTGLNFPSEGGRLKVLWSTIISRNRRCRHNVHHDTTYGLVSGADRYKAAVGAREVASEQKATRVLGLVFACFFVCWTPFFVLNLTYAFCPVACAVPFTIEMIFLWLGFISSTLNPIIYTIFNKKFRQSFVRIVFCCRRANRVSRALVYTASMTVSTAQPKHVQTT